MERKLASIRVIKDIAPIENADSIEVATVDGWHCVVKKGEFHVGEHVIYCEVDSVMPHTDPRFEWLRPRGFRVRTIKLRGQVSQGLVLPLSYLGMADDEVHYIGQDVTERLGIVKYEPPIPAQLRGTVKGNFPTELLSKTDEERIQNLQELLTKYKGVRVSMTEKLDGCLHPNSFIVTDQGHIPIGKIVNQELNVKVLSYNEELGVVEFKNISGYHKYPANKPMLSIRCDVRGRGNRAKYIRCTDNHAFFTKSGWKESKDLKVGDIIYHLVDQISPELEQLILGCGIGDGYISYNCNTLQTLHISHGESQYDYFEYIKLLCGSLFVEQKSHKGGYDGSTIQRRGLLRSNLAILRLLEKYCIREGKRKINQLWLDKLSPIGLAFWYMDDGSIQHRSEKTQKPRSMFNTHRYSFEEVKLLSDMLYAKYGIESTIGDKDTYKGYVINLTTEGTQILASLIAPYVCKNMKYKLPKRYENMPCVYDGITFSTLQGIVETTVLSIDRYDEPIKYVYDLTVEDNHNYFCQSILIHNSSLTCIYHDGEFRVCSRNLELLETDDNAYWKTVRSEHIEDKLKAVGKNIAIQGEMIGFGIQGNKYALKSTECWVFNVVDVDSRRYYSNAEVVEFCKTYGFKCVPDVGEFDLIDDIDAIVEMAKGNSKLNPKVNREGIVIRPVDPIQDPDFGLVSFKAINPNFLLKYDE